MMIAFNAGYYIIIAYFTVSIMMFLATQIYFYTHICKGNISMSEYTEMYSNATLMMLPIINLVFLMIMLIVIIYRLISRPNNINHWFNKLISWNKEIKIVSDLNPDKAINKPVEIELIRYTILGKLKCRYISEVPITAANYRWFGMVKFITTVKSPLKLKVNFHLNSITQPIKNSAAEITIDDHVSNSFYPTDLGFNESHPSLCNIFDGIDRRQSIKTSIIRRFIKDRQTKFYLTYFKTQAELNELTLEKTYAISDIYGTIFLASVLALFYDPLNNDEYTMKMYCYDLKEFVYIPVSEIIDVYAFNNHYEYGQPILSQGELRCSYSMKYLQLASQR